MGWADTVIAVVCYLMFINIAAFVAFAWDKYCAQNGMWRVSEGTLLLIASIGGSIGSVVAQQSLRHKTWKEPFRTHLLVIILAQIVIFIALLFPEVRNAVWMILLDQ